MVLRDTGHHGSLLRCNIMAINGHYSKQQLLTAGSAKAIERKDIRCHFHCICLYLTYLLCSSPKQHIHCLYFDIPKPSYQRKALEDPHITQVWTSCLAYMPYVKSTSLQTHSSRCLHTVLSVQRHSTIIAIMCYDGIRCTCNSSVPMVSCWDHGLENWHLVWGALS